MKIAIYPGSFDPLTLGHVDIVNRMVKLFDEVHIVVADSLAKSYLFSPNERLELIAACLPDPRVKAVVVSGLTVDYAKKFAGAVLVRGLRAVTDFDYEMVMANMNRTVAPQIDTLVMFASPEHSFLSSRFVKEISKNGGDVRKMVPAAVVEALKRK